MRTKWDWNKGRLDYRHSQGQNALSHNRNGVMPLTDKSAIALKPSDFKIIEGERRLSDVRLAQRLGFHENRQIRKLIERWQGFLEQQSGKAVHGEPLSGGRGFAGAAFWLTIPELIFIAGQSEAKNAPVVQYEAATIAAYWLEGRPAPFDTAPILRELTAPDPPQLVSVPSLTQRGDQLAFALTDRTDRTDYAPLPAHNANKVETWIETLDGVDYHITKKRNANGDVELIDHLRNPPLHTSTDNMPPMLMPWINGTQVRLRLNYMVPLAIVERTYLNQLPDDAVKDVARNTLAHFLAL
jgi:hypothetical protein